jgi:hypothetical protein
MKDNILGQEDKHESYAMLSISRVQNGGTGVNLFGSSIKHNQTIRLKISSGKKCRNLNRDWFYAGNQYIEIEMSPTQFAEAITSLNMGEGVPVTLRWLSGRGISDCPEENKRQEFEREFDHHMIELKRKIQKLTEVTKELLNDSKPLKKSEKEQILNELRRIEQEIGDNIPFMYTSFNEQMDKTILEAKGEIEAFYTHKITSLGIEALKDQVKMIEINREE